MGKKQLYGSLALLLASLIWGLAFVFQSSGMDYVGPITFTSVRCLAGALVLMPFIAFLDTRAGKKPSLFGTDDPAQRRDLLVGGILCGVLLSGAITLQQYGLLYTSVGKAGFITAIYIITVPLLRSFSGAKIRGVIWLSVAAATVGMYLLCINKESPLSFNLGDILVFGCSLLFAFHILVIDKYSPKVDGVRLSCLQFLVCGALTFVPMLVVERPTVPAILSAWVPLLYTSVMSCGVAYTLQILGQKNCTPVVATLVISMESVFSAVFGWLIIGQALSARETLGCVIIFAAVLLAQLPSTLQRSSGAAREE